MENVIAIDFKRKAEIDFDRNDEKNHDIDFFEHWVLGVDFDHNYQSKYKEIK